MLLDGDFVILSAFFFLFLLFLFVSLFPKNALPLLKASMFGQCFCYILYFFNKQWFPFSILKKTKILSFYNIFRDFFSIYKYIFELDVVISNPSRIYVCV